MSCKKRSPVLQKVTKVFDLIQTVNVQQIQSLSHSDTRKMTRDNLPKQMGFTVDEQAVGTIFTASHAVLEVILIFTLNFYSVQFISVVTSGVNPS